MSERGTKLQCDWCDRSANVVRDIKPPFRMMVGACSNHKHILDEIASKARDKYNRKGK